MKTISFDAIEGGILIHPPKGKAKVVPVSDDLERVAAVLGEMVLAILHDDAEPEVFADQEDDDDYEEEAPPRKKRRGGGGPRTGAPKQKIKIEVPRPQPNENADEFVHRVAAEAGVSGFKMLLKGLQRASK